jgi:hypothetical protein
MDAEDNTDGATTMPMEARESKFSSMENVGGDDGEDDLES